MSDAGSSSRGPEMSASAVKARIERVLTLVRDGRISEEQALELIDAIADRGPGQGRGSAQRERAARYRRDERIARQRARSGRRILRQVRRAVRRVETGGSSNTAGAVGDLDSIAATISGLVTDAVAGVDGIAGIADRFVDIGAPARWEDESNRVILSSAAPVSGEGYECRDNEINVSTLKELRFDDARFERNRVSASGIHALAIVAGSMRDCALSASSLTDSRIARGELTNCKLAGAKMRQLELDNGSIDACRFSASNGRGLRVSDSNMRECRFDAVTLRDFDVVNRSLVERLRLDGSSVRELKVSGSTIQDLVLRRTAVREFEVVDSTLKACKFGSSRGSLRGVTFVGMELEGCSFEDCRFTDVTFSGFALHDLELRGIRLKGCTVTSSEELRAVIDAHEEQR